MSSWINTLGSLKVLEFWGSNEVVSDIAIFVLKRDAKLSIGSNRMGSMLFRVWAPAAIGVCDVEGNLFFCFSTDVTYLCCRLLSAFSNSYFLCFRQN